MTIVSLFVTLIICGVCLYLINAIIPMPGWMRQVINALAGLFALLYVLQALGLYTLPLALK